MNKTLLATATVLALSIPALASAYNLEASAAVGEADTDFGDADLIGVSGTLYLQQVTTDKGPLAEAAFLNRASSVSLSYFELDPERFGSDIETTDLSGRLVTGDGLIIEGGWQDSDFGDTLSFGLGTYIDAGTSIIASYSSWDPDGSNFDIDRLGVDLHRVLASTGTSTLAWDAGLAYVDTDNDNGYGLSGGITYYPDTNLGFGAAIEHLDVGDYDATTFTLHGEYFFSPKLALGAAYTDTDDETGLELETILFSLTGRF